MAAYARDERGTLFSVRDVSPDQRWSKKFTDRCPRCFDPLVAEEWTFTGNAFAPVVHAFAIGGDQEDGAGFGATEAGLKEMLQRHAKFTDSYGLNFHCGRKTPLVVSLAATT